VSRDGRVFVYRFRAGRLDRATCAVAGACGGLGGIGVGAIVTTLLHLRRRMSIHLAAATSVFVVALRVLSAAASHALLAARPSEELSRELVPAMGLAVLAGGQFAPPLARCVPRRSCGGPSRPCVCARAR
jgi:uncharacterized membrane protein YfcA